MLIHALQNEWIWKLHITECNEDIRKKIVAILEELIDYFGADIALKDERFTNCVVALINMLFSLKLIPKYLEITRLIVDKIKSADVRLILVLCRNCILNPKEELLSQTRGIYVKNLPNSKVPGVYEILFSQYSKANSSTIN